MQARRGKKGRLVAITGIAVLMATLGLLVLPGCVSQKETDTSMWHGSSQDARTDLMASEPIDFARIKGQLSRPEALEGSLVRGSVDLGKSDMVYYSASGSAGASGGASGGTAAAIAPEKEPLAIVDHGPDGELPVEMRKPTIYVMFNHPIVPLAKLGDPITQTPIMKLEPPVKGVFRWYGTRVLSFEPEASLLGQPRYTVTISGETASLGGRKLGKDFSFAFYPETIKAVNFYPGGDADAYMGTSEVPTAAAKVLTLEFNQPVDPAFIKQFISVQIQKKEVGFSVSRPSYPERLASRTARGLLVSLDREPPENTTLTIIVKNGAAPQQGFPARSGDQKFSLRTVTPFRIVSLQANVYDMPRDNRPGSLPVYAEFSHSLNKTLANAAAYSIRVDGKPQSPSAITVEGNYVRFDMDKLKAGQKVELQAPASIQDIYARPLSNPRAVVAVTIPAPEPFVSFPSDDFNHLEAGFAPKLLWAARNLDSAALGIVPQPGFDFFKDKKFIPAPQSVDMAGWVKNEVHYSVVDLKPLLNPQGFGTVYGSWKASWRSGRDLIKDAQHFAIQVTDIGITTRYAYNRILVWANSLKTGAPIAGATVAIRDKEGRTVKEGKTDAQGLASIPVAEGEFKSLFRSEDYYYWLGISVTKDKDRADFRATDTQNSWNASSYGHSSPLDAAETQDRIFIFTDRGLYKPGEELALRGIHWMQSPAGFTPYTGDFSLRLTGSGSDKELWSYKGNTSISGGFAQRFSLPKDLEPGYYTIDYAAGKGHEGTVGFTIAEFRALSFQVSSTVPDRVFYAGDDISAQVQASYLAGGAMPGSAYEYYWTRKPQSFVPPGPAWKGYAFGPTSWEGERTLSSGKGLLSGRGTTSISEKTEGQNAAGSAYTYSLETTVQDIDRQSIANTAAVVVHPASFYIGARFASGSADGWWSRFVSTGKKVTLEAVLVDPQGKEWKKDAALTAKIILGTWKSTDQQGVYGRVNTRWEYVEEEKSSTTLAAKDGKASYEFQVQESGDYILSIEGKDSQGRLAKTAIRFYATGSEWAMHATETPSDIDMMLDKEEYLPGETARILVRSPLPEGEYLLTIEREGIFEQKIIKLKGSQNLLEVPVKEAYLPVFYVALSAYTKREAPPADYFTPDLGKPRGLFGIAGIRVSTKPVELDVEVLPLQAVYAPGKKAEVLVRVTRNGKPVPMSEVTILAVDRGVLDLIDYHVPNPLEFFYDPYNFPLGAQGDDSRRLLLKPVSYATAALSGGADMAKEAAMRSFDGPESESINERKDFRSLAFFEPFVATDKNGLAKISFTLPDSLTTYRLTAIALKENHIGFKEGEMLAQNPVNVRAALPRRFRNRDTAAAGVILQNLTSVAQKIDVSAASTILTISGESKKTVEVPAGGVYELPFLLAATKAGEGTISFTIQSALVNEKLTVPVIVEQPIVKEGFTTIGQIGRSDAAATEALILASKVAPGYGNLTIKASSTLAPYMEPAFVRLSETPQPWWGDYWRITGAFAHLYAQAHDPSVQALLAALQKQQLPEGGIYSGSWLREPYLPDPYISLLTAHLMEFAAARKGSAAQTEAAALHANAAAPDLKKLLSYLAGLKTSKKNDYSPYFRAYLAYVLAQGGRVDPAFMRAVEDEGDALGLGGYGLLAQAYMAADDYSAAQRVYERSKKFVLMGTQSVDVKQSYEATQYWSSLVAEMAIMLKNAYALGEDPGFVMRLAGSLNKTQRYWQTRNDDLWTLLGFIPLLDAETNSADAGATLTVKTAATGLASLTMDKARPTAESALALDAPPLSTLPKDTTIPLHLEKSGDTTVYYTSILRYALPVETAGPRDEGIEVSSFYESLDGKKVAPDELKLGETYRVRVNVATTKRRQRLELLVPLPSGVDIVDPNFVTTGRFANAGGTNDETIERETVYGDTISVSSEGYGIAKGYNWFWYWYSPESFALDNMMVYRWTDFYAGSRNISFLVRVTTPGIYPTPPAQASLEFEPEVFGRSGGSLFVIKP